MSTTTEQWEAMESRLDKAASVVLDTLKRQDQLDQRMAGMNARLAALEKALRASGAIKPQTTTQARREDLHARMLSRAEYLQMGPRTLARELGIPYQTVADWRKHKSVPQTAAHLTRIDEWLHTTTPEI
jgi:DNA-binding transcriptional regulator YiaG